VSDREDLDGDGRPEAGSAALVDLLDGDEDGQTHQGDEQFSHVGLGQVLQHRR